MENLPKFKVLKTIGTGTYGTVYLCLKRSTAETTIIKDIPIKSSADELKGAQNEINILSKLNHPNIIQYYDSYHYKNHILISMEYASGGNLHDYIYPKQTDYISQKHVLFFFSQILLGVDFIHSLNIIHRDLKAENILLTGRHGLIVKIGDFGIAKMLGGDQKTCTVIGTPYYLAPELCDGQPYDTKSDVWALGCLLYEMCTHQKAFQAETLTGLVKAITSDSVRPINNVLYERGVQDIIDGMLTILPEKRPTIKQVMGKNVLISLVYFVFLNAGDEVQLQRIFMT